MFIEEKASPVNVRKALFFSSYLRVTRIINIVKAWIRIRIKKKLVYLCFPLAFLIDSFKAQQDSYFPKA